MISFRKANKSDASFIAGVYNQNVPKKTVTADLNPVSVSDELSSLKNHNDKRPLWIIRFNHRRAGWVSLESFYGRPAYHATVEISIYLDDRFQHHGIGKSTLDFVSKQTGRLGIRTVLAFVFSVNVPSQKLFQAMGYHRYGHLPEVADMDGKLISLDILGKQFNR